MVFGLCFTLESPTPWILETLLNDASKEKRKPGKRHDLKEDMWLGY